MKHPKLPLRTIAEIVLALAELDKMSELTAEIALVLLPIRALAYEVIVTGFLETTTVAACGTAVALVRRMTLVAKLARGTRTEIRTAVLKMSETAAVFTTPAILLRMPDLTALLAGRNLAILFTMTRTRALLTLDTVGSLV